ncbi:Transmembrane protein 53 [Aphelenchoides besseyi]|nr:Transmembrane protein 53 [Aphelenchoides besseyi]KAI6193498.1 Transmembrane protein 53 [Aphelenchoides besseyi]
MHSWYRSLVLPAASITISVGSSEQKRKSTKPTRSAEGSPRPWAASILATTLVTSSDRLESRKQDDQLRNGNLVESPTLKRREEVDSATNNWSAGCNPLSGMSCTSKNAVAQIVEENGTEKQVAESVQNVETSSEEVDANLVLRTAIASSTLRTSGTLSANVSSTQLEQLVMKPSTDPRKPLIILFGWAGCNDRYLSKYATYYESQGYAVARFTVPIAKVRSFSSYRRYALQIYEEILQAEPNRPIFFHLFSMNGHALWDLLAHLSDGPDIKQRVQGLIFDSSPANVLPWQAANAVSFAMFPPTKFSSIPRESCRLALAGVFSMHRAMVWLQSNFNPQSYEKHYAYFRLMKFVDLPQHQLFLYSDADEICVRESIEQFQRAQQERLVQVKQRNFKDSKHCEHFRTYTDDYIRQCLSFIEETANTRAV